MFSPVVIRSTQMGFKKTALSIIHNRLDLWTCEISGRNDLGIHVFWVNRNFILRHALIAVSEAPFATSKERLSSPHMFGLKFLSLFFFFSPAKGVSLV